MKYVAAMILFMLMTTAAVAQADQQMISLGNKLYKQQQFEKAAEEYRKAAALNEKNVKAQYNLGNAFYRGKKLPEAEKAFDVAATNSTVAAEKANALYNKGVSLSQQKKLKESIDTYKNSLRLAPDDTQARENLQKALNELKQQQQQKQTPQQNDQQKNDDKKNPEPQQPKNKSNLSKKQAEKLLNALQQEEKNIQKDQQKNKARNNNQPEKDW